MCIRIISLLLLFLGCSCAAPAKDAVETVEVQASAAAGKDDLDSAASNSYVRRYSDWGGYSNGYNSGVGAGVTGYGNIDDRYNSYYGGGGYDTNTYGYNSGNNQGYGNNVGFGNNGYGNNGYGFRSYANNGYGGYGGYGGNGGLNSYYGYNNPYYQGGNHLGFGYYNRKQGLGNIYSSGITPNLVTGYRGYSRR